MALRRTGADVGLFDADLYGPNIPIMMGLRQKESRMPFSIRNKSTGESLSFIPLYTRDDRPYIEPTQKFGIHVMSLGLWFSEKDVARDSSFLGSKLVTQVLSDILWPSLDYLIIDLPPGTDQLLQEVVERAGVDGMLLVTTPQDMTLLDAGRSLELFRSLEINVLGRIENMSYLRCDGCGKRIDIYSRGYDDWQILDELPLLGSIPLDPGYARPVDADHPFTQVDIHTDVTKPFLTIAERIKTGLL